jgi:hypothetical protein
LLDGRGGVAAQLDGQPGYGFEPSTLWPAGVWTNDRQVLDLPTDGGPGPPYALLLLLYRVGDGSVVLRRGLGELVDRAGELVFMPYEPIFDLPAGLTAADAHFGQQIALQAFTLQQDAATLNLALYWRALVRPAADYHHFVHLVDRASGALVAQHDSMPRGGAYPTGQWAPGEVVADSVTIDLAAVPAGEYELVVGLYENLGDAFPRLPAVDERGRRLPGDGLPLPVPILIPPR